MNAFFLVFLATIFLSITGTVCTWLKHLGQIWLLKYYLFHPYLE